MDINQLLVYRKATMSDVAEIITLLVEDELGQTRESISTKLDQRYIDAFRAIDMDPNQYLMVVEANSKIIGTCQITLIPSLTFLGSTRMQIEAVRVASQYRGKKVGQWMISQAIDYGKSKGASIIQLTTNKTRLAAKRFYEWLGFEATHEGMKLYLTQ